jgi:hypothetical protein
MKVDAEGHDLPVIRGFYETIAAGKIDFIQFEYNYFSLIARWSLKDFFDLAGNSFALCRLLPQGLEACGYHVTMDNFGQSNWVMIRDALIDQDLVEHLKIRPAKGLPGQALREQLSPDSRLRAALGL